MPSLKQVDTTFAKCQAWFSQENCHKMTMSDMRKDRELVLNKSECSPRASNSGWNISPFQSLTARASLLRVVGSYAEVYVCQLSANMIIGVITPLAPVTIAKKPKVCSR